MTSEGVLNPASNAGAEGLAYNVLSHTLPHHTALHSKSKQSVPRTYRAYVSAFHLKQGRHSGISISLTSPGSGF